MRSVLLPSMLAAILTMVLAAPPVQACLNDRETTTKETEFQVQYTRSITETPAPAVEEGSKYFDYALIGAGGVLGMTGLGIGLGVGITLTRKPN
jgi:hypothetical protein